MTKLRICLIASVLIAPAFAQAPPAGRSIVWTNQTTCQDPAGTMRGQCITDDKRFLISVNGGPYQDPLNFTGGGAGTITVGITTTGLPGTAASVTDSGVPPNHVFNFVIPQGAPGGPGPSGTMTIGAVATGAPGSAATVKNVGTASAAIFNFSIPQGMPGTGTSFTSFTCTTFSGKPLIDANGVWTFSGVAATGCVPK